MTPTDSMGTATLSLRPPRVALLIPDDDRWRDWAAHALRVASSYWGGGGFILVPFDPSTATPHVSFERVVRAYDPDHVVTLPLRAAQYEEWYPGSIKFEGDVSKSRRADLLRHAVGTLEAPGGSAAREVVAGWCSPMRNDFLRREEAKRARETVTRLTLADQDRPARGLVARSKLSGPVLAASIGWTSDVGLAAAARVGVASGYVDDRPEPSPNIFA